MTDNFYAGKSVDVFVKSAIVAMLFHGAERQLNVMYYGDAGCGKSEIPLWCAKHVFGADRVAFVKIHPSSSKGDVEGHQVVDLSEKDTVRIVKDIKRTFADPDIDVAFIDEMTRGNDATHGVFIHGMEDKENPHKPIFMATSNFAITDDKLKALNDRLGLNVWIDDDLDESWEDVVNAQASGKPLSVKQSLPTLQDILAINALQENVTESAVALVRNTIGMLKDEGKSKGFHVNKRHISMWTHLLIRTSILEFGTADFTKLSSLGLEALQWAQVLLTPEEAHRWKEVAQCVGDPVQAAIDEVIGSAYAEFKRVAAITSPTDRSREAGTLGTLMANAQADLRALLGQSGNVDEHKIDETMKRLNDWFMCAVQGKPVEA